MDDERRARFLRYFTKSGGHLTQPAGVSSVSMPCSSADGGQRQKRSKWDWIENSLRCYSGGPIALFTNNRSFSTICGPRHEDTDAATVCIDRAEPRKASNPLPPARRAAHQLRPQHRRGRFSLDGIYHVWAPSTACARRPDGVAHGASAKWDSSITASRRMVSLPRRRHGLPFRHENYIRKLGAVVRGC